MSRHRDFRNLNIHDELDDEALDDGGEEELTPEQYDQMVDGLDHVRQVIGDEGTSELSDASIKEALWGYYFDVEKTIQWALEERERRQVAKERKGGWPESEGSSSSADRQDEGVLYEYQLGNQSGQLWVDEDQLYSEPEVRTGMPKIFENQQHLAFDPQYLTDDYTERRSRLSTITEMTERTEPSVWRNRQQYLVPNTPRSFVSSPTTSYGEAIDNTYWVEGNQPLDPNTSRTSPSLSAIKRLSTYDPPPSNSSSVTHNEQSDNRTASEPLPSLENLPSIEDPNSQSDQGTPRQLHFPLKAASNKSVSKLSKLANSRASSVTSRSESSRSSGTAVTGSIKTFPGLRPSAQSERPPSSVVSSKDLPPIPPTSATTTPSETSSIVRRAINAALELEAVDREATPKPYRPQSPISDVDKSSESNTPIPEDFRHRQRGPAPALKEVATPSGLPLSKLALIAQQKSDTSGSPTLPSPASSLVPSRPLSKLATLAQQKVDATRKPKLPRTTTEYLTPIANGPSVTTAITTSYQSLYSLTDPSKRVVIPALNVVPLQTNVGASVITDDYRPSKLAMKIKRANQKASSHIPNLSLPEDHMPPISPLFQVVKGRTRKEGGKHHHHKDPKERGNVSDFKVSNDNHPHRRKHRHPKPPHNDTAPTPSFSFDAPSPDDIVLSARKGTALGQKSLPPTPSPRSTVGAGKLHD